MAEWIKGGGKLKKHMGFDELLYLRWRVQSDKKVRLKSKKEMLDDGIQSPDVADSLALTFAKTTTPPREKRRKRVRRPVSPYETI